MILKVVEVQNHLSDNRGFTIIAEPVNHNRNVMRIAITCTKGTVPMVGSELPLDQLLGDL